MDNNYAKNEFSASSIISMLQRNVRDSVLQKEKKIQNCNLIFIKIQNRISIDKMFDELQLLFLNCNCNESRIKSNSSPRQDY